jgi:glycosyltransferase involved in cell wall biosynthesis
MTLDQLAFGSIVHVNEKGGSFGGTEEYIALLTAELTALGVTSHLVCGAVVGEVPVTLTSVDIVEDLASRRSRPHNEVLTATIKQLDADVIYLHNLFDSSVVAAVAAIEPRRPIIWYVHDHYLTCLSELRWRRDLGSCHARLGRGCLESIDAGQCILRHRGTTFDLEELERRQALSDAIKHVDAVVVVSEYMRSLLVEAQPGHADKVHLVPRPIRHTDEEPARSRSKPGDPVVVTFAGRITPEKGLSTLIEALGAVRSDARIELRIAGVIEHEGYWARCRRAQQHALAANPLLDVSYCGHLAYSETDSLFRRSDIVAIPSQWPEPLGAVAIEAMAAGAVVVASDIGGLRSHLIDGQNGWLVEPSDVSSWTAAIESLIRSPGYAHQLASRARADVATLTAKAHLASLNEVIRLSALAR